LENGPRYPTQRAILFYIDAWRYKMRTEKENGDSNKIQSSIFDLYSISIDKC
jgi:hypothetical protein